MLPHRRRPTAAALVAALVAGGALLVGSLVLGACGDDAGTAAPTTTSTTQAPTPSEVLASCSPAVGSDFVAVERHLAHGGQHLGQGFISADGPDGHYLSADVYDVDNRLLATALVWRISPDGATAETSTPETDQWDQLPDVPAAENQPHPELQACTRAALALADQPG